MRWVGKSPKLHPVWLGPYVVTQQLTPVFYWVRDRKEARVQHRDRLKAYHADTILV